MRTGISDQGKRAVAVCLDDIPQLSNTTTRVRYAIREADMGRNNVPKDFLASNVEGVRIVRGKTSRQRKCSVIWLETPFPLTLRDSLLQGMSLS